MSVESDVGARGRSLPALAGGVAPRRVAEALFPDAEIHYVDRFEAMADLLDTFADQRPATCGAYVTRYLLAPMGFEEHAGYPTTREDYLALLAGTVIEADEAGSVEAVRAEVERLKLSDADAVERFGERYYAWPLRSSADAAVAGTSPTGTARIISLASGGALATLPVPARREDGEVLLTAAVWDRLLSLLERRLGEWRLHLIANYESDQLLDPTAAAYDVEALRSPDPMSVIPLDSWGVGHFAGIGALWQAGDGRRWLLLLDTYRSRGFSRYEPQPADLMRAGLVRSDGRDGGLLIVLPSEFVAVARTEIEGLGLEDRMWGNGSIEPEGWRWEPGR